MLEDRPGIFRHFVTGKEMKGSCFEFVIGFRKIISVNFGSYCIRKRFVKG